MVKFRKGIAVLACLLMAMCVLASCGSGSSSTGAKKSNALKPVDKEDCLEVETKTGTLKYPDQWEEFAKAKVDESGDSTVVHYTAAFDKKTFDLFDVTIGKGEGSKVGEIKGEDGKTRPVYVDMKKLEGIDKLSKTKQDRLYAMQEDVNYIIDNLK